ncbi:hypothetical protein B7P43_G10111 [Cryptotermes secundus]|uniref:Reverse transcriptase domain-containing protein n=1 Tax=Cryptotermes secundus TaxID=105785 RepID=A0A2J7QUZ1_9NEOP|nr:hypothetical protein B7P43_G10111 [Cryptotermes secundus]PNF32403.1 hypothetical protein B7P43_G10111 [Cryptotermes secundus]PNF32404.1 hypothetical protein B7P43_G10111 [Cryptotermes secundus]
MTNPGSNSITSIKYHNNVIFSSTNVKFLGLAIESSCTWKAHISQLMPKLCKACYSMRVIKPIMPTDIKNGILLLFPFTFVLWNYIWGNSYSMHIFRIQKRIIIRTMSGLRSRDSCGDAFRDWGILPLQSQYIFSLLMFVANNMHLYHTTSHINGLNTRRNFDLCCPQTNLTTYQRGLLYFGIKLLNHLPLNIKELIHNIKQFRAVLSVFLRTKSYYTLDEYFN